MKKIIQVLALSFLYSLALAADPVLSPNAPPDRPIRNNLSENFEKAIAPYVAHAKATYPQAKERFLAGLPKGQAFFLTTRLADKNNHFEQVFIAVQEIKNGVVKGKIWSDIERVEGFHHGDSYSFPEVAMLDWLITKADGSEEGNFVGKYMDPLHTK